MKYEQIYSLRNAPSNDYSEQELTRLFEVSRSGYRAYTQKPEERPPLRELKLVAEMKRINNDPDLKCYGSPRVTEELNALGYKVSKNTTARLMRKHGIRARRKWGYKPPKTTCPDPQARYNENLIKKRPPTAFGQQLVSDITYIPTQEGWLYLSVVMDLYTRLIVGWESSGTMPASLVEQSLENTLYNWSVQTQDATFHSDRGSQYSSNLIRKWLKNRGIAQSMSDKGNCYDNAHCESFFASLKAECLPECGYFSTREEARHRLFGYIEGFYNTRRRHSSLGYLSPIQYYHQSLYQLALAA